MSSSARPFGPSPKLLSIPNPTTLRDRRATFCAFIVFALRSILLPHQPTPEHPKIQRHVTFTVRQTAAATKYAQALGLIEGPDHGPIDQLPSRPELLQELALSLIQQEFSHEIPNEKAFTSLFVLFSSVSAYGNWSTKEVVANNLSSLSWSFRVISFQSILDLAAFHKQTDTQAMQPVLYFLNKTNNTVWQQFRRLSSSISTDKHQGFIRPNVHTDGDILSYSGHSFRFHQAMAMLHCVRTMFHDSLQFLLTALNCEHLLKVQFETHKLDDHIANSAVGYSFLDHSANKTLGRPHLLFEAMTKNPLYAHRVGSSPPRYDRNNVHSIVALCRAVKKRMLAFVHIGGGGAARVTEEAVYQTRNLSGRLRSVCYMYGRVVFISGYTKTSHRGRDSSVARAMDVEASNWIIITLRWVSHLLYMIQLHVYKASQFLISVYGNRLTRLRKQTDVATAVKELDYCFWDGQKLPKSEDINSTLRLASSRTMGFDLNVRAWRHINQLIHVETLVPDTGSEIIKAAIYLHSSHSPDVAQNSYAVSTQDVQRRSRDHLKTCILISIAHHTVRFPFPPPCHLRASQSRLSDPTLALSYTDFPPET